MHKTCIALLTPYCFKFADPMNHHKIFLIRARIETLTGNLWRKDFCNLGLIQLLSFLCLPTFLLTLVPIIRRVTKYPGIQKVFKKLSSSLFFLLENSKTSDEERALIICFKFTSRLSLVVTEVVTVWVWFKPDYVKNKKQNKTKSRFSFSPVHFQFKK